MTVFYEPRDLTAEEHMNNLAMLYQTNFTEPGIPFTLGSIEVVGFTFNGRDTAYVYINMLPKRFDYITYTGLCICW